MNAKSVLKIVIEKKKEISNTPGTKITTLPVKERKLQTGNAGHFLGRILVILTKLPTCFLKCGS